MSILTPSPSTRFVESLAKRRARTRSSASASPTVEPPPSVISPPSSLFSEQVSSLSLSFVLPSSLLSSLVALTSSLARIWSLASAEGPGSSEPFNFEKRLPTFAIHAGCLLVTVTIPPSSVAVAASLIVGVGTEAGRLPIQPSPITCSHPFSSDDGVTSGPAAGSAESPISTTRSGRESTSSVLGTAGVLENAPFLIFPPSFSASS
mmetsp:Transcript_14787/g.29610  ORF Transcript_14787/g.29610 Transcript_14787/m.29610 type:complete len:206 (-) Transcript_14787:197-814(-)